MMGFIPRTVWTGKIPYARSYRLHRPHGYQHDRRTYITGHLSPEDFMTDRNFIDSTIGAAPLLGPARDTKIAAVGGAPTYGGHHIGRCEYVTNRLAHIMLQYSISAASLTTFWPEESPPHYNQWMDVYADPRSGQIALTSYQKRSPSMVESLHNPSPYTRNGIGYLKIFWTILHRN